MVLGPEDVLKAEYAEAVRFAFRSSSDDKKAEYKKEMQKAMLQNAEIYGEGMQRMLLRNLPKGAVKELGEGVIGKLFALLQGSAPIYLPDFLKCWNFNG